MKSTKNSFLDRKIIQSNECLYFNSWVVIISVYNPPEEFYVSLFKLLNNPVDVYIIDSSPEGIYNSNALLRQYVQMKRAGCTKYIYIENLGQPYKLNLGIEEALKSNYEFITIFTDDTFLLKDVLPFQLIKEFFYKNCNPHKDILLLPTDPKTAEKRYIRRSTEQGMTFHREVLTHIKFREDLVIDQFDLYFCDDIYRIGGKIVVYPDLFLKVLPIGRDVGKGKNLLPPWRLYLLTRNTVALYLLHKNSFISDVLLQNFYWYTRSLLYGNNKIIYLKVFLVGLVDGLHLKLGITENLQKYSNNRFLQIRLGSQQISGDEVK